MADPADLLSQTFKAIDLSGHDDFPKSLEAKVRSATLVAKTAAEVEAISAAKLSKRSNRIVYASPEQERQFNGFLRGRAESRDMIGGGGAYPGSAGSGFVPPGFEQSVIERQRLRDQIVDPALVTYLFTARGSAHALPLDDDVSATAHVVNENTLDSVTTDPLMGGLLLNATSTFRTSLFLSLELFQDSGVPLDEWLADILGKRFGRAFGQQMAAVLQASAAKTTTAAGASASGQSGLSTTIGSADLWALAATLEPAYWLRSSWAMSFTTFANIMSLRSTSTGQPIFPEPLDRDGNPTLCGRRVAISPSLGTSVILGDLKRLIARVAGGLNISVSREKRPESGQLYVRALLREQAAASIDSRTTDAPFVSFSNVLAASERSQPPAKLEGGHHEQGRGRTARA